MLAGRCSACLGGGDVFFQHGAFIAPATAREKPAALFWGG
jgi:hypothetical protein